MGAHLTSALTEGPFQGLSTDGGPQHTDVCSRAAGDPYSDPGAFQHDVVMVFCDPERDAGPEPNGTSHLGEESEGLPPDL